LGALAVPEQVEVEDMTHMRHFATSVAAIGLLAWAMPAGAQVIIGETSQPAVEVNLGVLQGLSAEPAATQTSAASGSVLLIAPPSGSTTAPASSGGSVLLLDQPATLPAPASQAQAGQVFVFPEVPGTKPAAPAAEPAAASVVTPPDPDPVAIVVPKPEPEPVAIVAAEPDPEPVAIVVAQPDPEPVATVVAQPEPVAVAASVVAQNDSGAATASDDPFAQLDDLLGEPVAPEEIRVPEPDMEIDAQTVVVSSGSTQVTPSGLDLRILFEPGSETMTEADRTLLRELAGRLAADQNQRIQLRAYASSDDGTDSAARRLALSRALHVRAFLIENDVRSTRIDVRALGDRVEDQGPLDRIDVVLVES